MSGTSWLLLAVFIPMLVFASEPVGDFRELTDATQVQVKLKAKPKRIVTLAPSLGELVADLLGTENDKLVGVSEYTDYPPILKKVTSIGPFHQFSLEKVLALKPDLVLATLDGNPREKVLHLRELGIPVVTVATEDFLQMENSILLVSEALGVKDQGRQMANQLKTGIDRIRGRGKGRPPVRVMLQVGDKPLVVAGGKSFLHQALKAIGAENIYEGAPTHYPRPSVEDVLHKNPDVIVVVAMNGDLEAVNGIVRRWNEFKSLAAVRKNKVILLSHDGLVRPTLRILEGLSLLDRAIYGK